MSIQVCEGLSCLQAESIYMSGSVAPAMSASRLLSSVDERIGHYLSIREEEPLSRHYRLSLANEMVAIYAGVATEYCIRNH